MSDERVTHPVRCDAVKVGDLMAFTYYAKVTGVGGAGQRLQCEGLDAGLGLFEVNGKALVELAASADQAHATVKVSMTEAAQLLIDSPRRPLTVCFTKEDGTERVLRGRLVSHEAVLGRSHVEDLDQPAGDRLRLVDHRTIRWIIVDGTRYEVGRKPRAKKGAKAEVTEAVEQ